MECGCQSNACSIDDYDGPEFFDVSWCTARKEHICLECRKTIKPGDKYEYTAGKWDGEFETFKTCKPCVAIWNEYFCGCRIYGDLNVMVYELLGVEL